MSPRPAIRRLAILLSLFTLAALLVALPVTPLVGSRKAAAHAAVAVGDVVFNDVSGGYSRIAIRTGSGITDLTPTSLQTGTPDVSPDGSRIAFWAQDTCVDYSSYQSVGLQVMNSDGSGRQWLTLPHCHAGGAGAIADSFPRWSPDGTELAYVHQDDSGYGSYSSRIYKVNADGTGVTALTTTDQEYDPPSWSPDGSEIVFDTWATSYNQLYIMDADGSNKHLLPGSESSYGESFPTWSPDGNRIYFSSSPGIYGNFWYYSSSNGFATTSVTRHQVNGATLPVSLEYDLSADGSTIVYRGPADGSLYHCPELWTLDISGATSDQVTSDTCSGNEDPSYVNPRYVKAAWPNASTKNLVALGDSVAAGEGINYGWNWDGDSWEQTGLSDPDWMDTTRALGDDYQQCHQSGHGYPQMLAQNGLNYNVFNMACTGAEAFDGILKAQTTVNPDLDYPQLGGSCTGCDALNTYFDDHNPDVVTLTVGANDIHFGGLDGWIATCIALTCGSSANDTTLSGQLSTQANNLRVVLQRLNAWAYSKSKTLRVLVTNYYNPFDPAHAGCDDYNGISTTGTGNELAWLIQGLGRLNNSIVSEISYAQTDDTYLSVVPVDLSKVMAGHEWCTDVPWAYGMGTVGTPAPFHPTLDGQRAIYEAVKRVLDGNGDFVTNGTFESGTANGWHNDTTNATPSVSTTEAHSGRKSMTFTGQFNVTDSPTAITTPSVDTVQADFWVKGPSGATVQPFFRQYLNTAPTNNTMYQTITLNGSWQHVVTNAFHLYSPSSSLYSSATPGVDFNINNTTAGSSTVFYFDDIHEYGYTDTETCGHQNLVTLLNGDAVENCGGEAPYGMQGWAANDSNVTVTSDNTDHHDGLYSFKLVANANATITMNDSGDWRGAGEVSTSATSCTATAWMKGPNLSGRTLKLRIREYNGTFVGDATATQPPNGSWQQLSVTRTLGSGHDSTTHLDLNPYMTGAQTGDVVRVDHITEACS